MVSAVFVYIIIHFTIATFSDGEACNPLIIGVHRVPAYDNKKISQSVMGSVSNLTMHACLKHCIREEHCTSFHYTSVDNTCIGLGGKFEGVTITTTDVPGYKLYQTTKPLPVPGCSCGIDADCVAIPNTHCEGGICACDIGYGNNQSTCRALTECTVFTSNFTMFKNHGILGHDITSDTKPRADCMQMCVDNPACTCADYDNTANRCLLKSDTWLDPSISDGERVTSSTTLDHYQRICDW